MTFYLIGEAPSRTSDPSAPLSAPATRKRLIALIGARAYLRATKKNLLDAWPGSAGKGSRFPILDALESAREFLADAGLTRRDDVILLGRRVARAFEIKKIAYFERTTVSESKGNFYVFPHPSGVSRWWNDPTAIRRAKRKARRFR